jgi:DNA-binding transcriptional LysR family regulator
VVAVADHRSFTGAARSLHVAQPTLSHGVRTLEDELGIELFQRLGRTIAITAAGEAVVDSARAVLLGMTDVVAAAAQVSRLASGSIRVVALPTLAVDPLAALIGRFRVAHPGVAVHVLEPEDTDDVERSVRTGSAELGLTDITTGGAGLVRVPLFRQEIVVVSPPGDDERAPLTARQLVDLPLIVTPPGTSTRRLLDRTVAREGRAPRIAVELNHREAIVPLVLAGAGSALLPRRLAADAAQRGAIVRPLQPPIGRRVGMLHRRGRLSPAADAMLSLARELRGG